MNLTKEDIDVLNRWWVEKSRKNFLAYRRFIGHGRFEYNWFIADFCAQLQQFYLDLKAGKKPILCIQASPQHGKSWTVSDFISWLIGKQNDLRIIFASYSDKLGRRCNSAQQRVMVTQKYKDIFPETCLPDRAGGGARTTDHIEFVDSKNVMTNGQFRNTTVAGPITGESLDCVDENTEVLTDQGSSLIKDLAIGDRVLTCNHSAGRTEYEEVTFIKRVEKNEVYRITPALCQPVECTADHEFYTVNGGYKKACELTANVDRFLGTFGAQQKVVSIEKINRDGVFYDITVNKNHNFFANGILVHNCGIIDDAVKGREQANSILVSEKIWDWFTDDFMSRFSKDAGLLIIMTRWTTHDLIGRLKEKCKETGQEIKIVNYQAIATEDEEHRKTGEALFPAIKPLDFLKIRKSLMDNESWESLYQGSPSIKGGNLIKDAWWKWWKVLPPLTCKFITVDTAQKTKERNDWTDFKAWGVCADQNIYLLDHLREKMEAPTLRREAEMFYKKHDKRKTKATDPVLRGMFIEDKSSGTGLIQEMKVLGFKIEEVPRNTDKVFRMQDASPYIKAGRVYLNTDIPDIDNTTKEAREFPNSKHDDDIDTVITAIEVAFIYEKLTGPIIGVI